MYTCICAAVTTQQVEATILSGAHTVEEIGRRCGAGTGCGSCLDELDLLLEDHVSHTRSVDQLPRIA